MFTEECLQKLGNDLFVLNTDAVNHRYDERDSPVGFFWMRNSLFNRFQALKSMQCLKYQCSKGDYHKTKLFKLLGELISRLSEHIVSSLPEYEEAEWG